MTQPADRVDRFEMLRFRADDPPNIKALRIAVIAMGVILIAGVATVIGRVIYLAMRTPTVSAMQPLPGPVTAGAGAVAGALAGDVNLALPAGAKVRSQSLDGSRLSVHYEGGGAEGIIILDLETGKPLGHVHIQAGK